MGEDAVVVVGGSLAGWNVAQGLRRGGWEGTITLVGEEQHRPYDRPPLSKELLAGDWPIERIELAPDELLAPLELELCLGRRAARADVGEATVFLDDGEPLRYDHLVIATGAAPRALSTGDGLDGVFSLRTLDDALALRSALDEGTPRVVVIGAGFIGSEVAATARGKGLEVTVVEALPVPLARGLGPMLGPAVARLHGDHGVELRCGAGVASIEGGGRVERVVLADGTELPADVVVVGVGVVPATGWLDGSGLSVADGLVCDSTCRALDAPNVWGAGDVARWDHPVLGSVRLEHWDNAANQGAAVAGNVLASANGEPLTPYGPVPFVWSQQYDVMVQILGRVGPEDRVHVPLGTVEERSFVALVEHAGMLGGVVGVGDRRTMRFRRLLQTPTPIGDALAFAAGIG